MLAEIEMVAVNSSLMWRIPLQQEDAMRTGIQICKLDWGVVNRSARLALKWSATSILRENGDGRMEKDWR